MALLLATRIHKCRGWDVFSGPSSHKSGKAIDPWLSILLCLLTLAQFGSGWANGECDALKTDNGKDFNTKRYRVDRNNCQPCRVLKRFAFISPRDLYKLIRLFFFLNALVPRPVLQINALILSEMRFLQAMKLTVVCKQSCCMTCYLSAVINSSRVFWGKLLQPEWEILI